jgi:hypothetical protein
MFLLAFFVNDGDESSARLLLLRHHPARQTIGLPNGLISDL